MSARAQIRKAVANSISTSVADVGGRVFARRRTAIRQDELPCVLVLSNEASVEYVNNSDGPGNRIQRRTVTTSVSLLTAGQGVSVDDDADALAAEVQASLSDFSTLIPKKIDEGQLVGERTDDVEIEGGFAVMTVLTYQHVVLTNESQPNQLV